MLKNPFVNCKSRKRRKQRVVINKPQSKGYCPRTMVRYDNSPNEYKTAWVCKMCLKFLLSEDAAKDHSKVCNTKTFNKPHPTPKSVEDMRYICEFCNKIFSRQVTLKKHKEEHEKSSSGLESEDEDKNIISDEDKIDNDENNIVPEENENLVGGNEIVPIVVAENEILPIVVDENKIVIGENKIVDDDKIEVDNGMVVNENMTVVDEHMIVVDENKIETDNNKVLVDNNKILVINELESTKNMDTDNENQNLCENPTI